MRVWRYHRERYEDCNMVEHDPFGGGSIMVWRGISMDGCMELIPIRRGTMNAQRYRDEVLALVVVPYDDAIGEDIFYA